LSKIYQIVNQIRECGANPSLTIGGILMTMFMRNNLATQVIAEVQNHFGDVIFKTVVPRTVRLSEAPSHGKPINEYDPGGLGATAYKTLATEFLERHKWAPAAVPA
jgi:chromosome partitioning protein